MYATRIRLFGVYRLIENLSAFPGQHPRREVEVMLCAMEKDRETERDFQRKLLCAHPIVMTMFLPCIALEGIGKLERMEK